MEKTPFEKVKKRVFPVTFLVKFELNEKKKKKDNPKVFLFFWSEERKKKFKILKL